MIKIVVLGSGSSGNATYIDIDGRRFLVDCGFTKPATTKRLATFGRTIEDIEGVLVSHDHKDHTSPWIVRDGLLIKDTAGTPFTTFELSHDEPCVGYTAKDKDGNKIAIISDTGCVQEEAIKHLFGCSVILIETNYDVFMLAQSSYPVERMERIVSEDGHLRSECAAEVVEMVACEKLKYIVCMHLSSSNNHPDLVRFCMNSIGTKAEVVISEQKKPSRMITIL
jgi:phosphoribosyl 1,2-cyclic phosphodiesterase